MALFRVTLLVVAGLACYDAFTHNAFKHHYKLRPTNSVAPSRSSSDTLSDFAPTAITSVADMWDQPPAAEAQQKKIRKGAEPEFAIAGDSLEETPTQRLIVGVHFALLLANLVTAFAQFDLSSPVDLFSVSALVYFSVVLGDLGTGVFHWSVDNYGSLKTPLVGTVCAAFQGHHETPWTITFRPFANNVYKIASGTIPVLGAMALLPAEDFAMQKIFFSLFANWWLVSQELHKYAHMRKVPPAVQFLQNAGIILSRKEHGLHHSSPFEAHYCILTGQCNGFLDKINFFRGLEKVVFELTGNRPITWNLDESVEQLAMGTTAAAEE